MGTFWARLKTAWGLTEQRDQGWEFGVVAGPHVFVVWKARARTGSEVPGGKVKARRRAL